MGRYVHPAMPPAGAHPKIPLIILGGSDRTPADLPPAGRDKHPISGCKGIDIRLAGRCLIDHLVERLQSAGGFDPIWVAGPAEAYRQASVTLRVINTDRSFGENIQAALETVLETHAGSEVGVITCDILPDVGELRLLLENYWQEAPSDLWFPVIVTEKGDRLGPSDWKPRYRIVPHRGAEPVSVLPGHLTIFDPGSLRLAFLYRLFDLAYRTRNRPIRYRRSYILRHVLWSLLRQDLLHLLDRRLPTLTWDVVRSGVRAANRLRKGTVSRGELEHAIRRVFVKRRHRRRHPERRIRLPLLHTLSIARDIDTEEEALAMGATFG